MARKLTSAPVAWLPFLSLSLAACGPCCDYGVESGPPPLPPPKVAWVRVQPATIHASAGAVFTLTARAFQADSLPVAVPDTDLAILWVSSTPVFANPGANPVTVVVPEAPGTTFTFRAKVTGPAPFVGLPPKEHESNLVTVHVTPARSAALESNGDSDWIQVEHVPGNPPAALLIQATDQGVEVADWPVGVVGSARLGRNLAPFTAPSLGAGAASVIQGVEALQAAAATPVAELALFAQDRYMELWPPGGPPGCRQPSPACPWTDKVDDLIADPLAWDGERILPIRAAMADLQATVAGMPIEAWVKSQADQALALFNANRAGLGHEWLGTFEHTIRDPDTGEPRPVEGPSATCSMIDDYIGPDYSVRHRSDLPKNVPALFVVWVPEVLSVSPTPGVPPTRQAGVACTPGADWVGRVVLMSLNDYNLTTLAHEIGHILSLSGHHLPSGHTNGLKGFHRGNLMYSANTLATRQPRHHLTLGQLYRVNAHPASWLNVLLSPADRRTRACARSVGRGACPALAADLDG